MHRLIGTGPWKGKDISVKLGFSFILFQLFTGGAGSILRKLLAGYPTGTLPRFHLSRDAGAAATNVWPGYELVLLGEFGSYFASDFMEYGSRHLPATLGF